MMTLNFFGLRKLFLIILFFSFSIPLMVSVPVPALAASFDGTYDYTYNLKGPNGWETHRVKQGFIIKNNIISSNPSALAGSVRSSGVVQFTGPCPYGDPIAEFSGTIESGGNGSGTYSCSYSHTGSWSVNLVSGEGDSLVDQIFSFFSDLGNFFFPSSDEFVNAIVGISICSIPFSLGLMIFGVNKRRAVKLQRTRNDKTRFMQDHVSEVVKTPGKNFREGGASTYQTSGTNSEQTMDVPSKIALDHGHLMEASGEVITSPKTPSSLKINAKWLTRQVHLSWDELQYDPNIFSLEGYLVSSMNYNQSGTSAVKTIIDKLPPNQTQWVTKYKQTYRWNTRGDTEGFMVEAIFRQNTSSGTIQTIKIGGIAYAPYPP